MPVYGIINIILNNSYILHTHKPENSQISRRKYALELAIALCRPFAHQRLFNKFLRRELKATIETVFEVERPETAAPEEASPSRTSKRQRCYLCPSTSNTRTKMLCVKCHKATCNHHVLEIYQPCYNL